MTKTTKTTTDTRELNLDDLEHIAGGATRDPSGTVAVGNLPFTYPPHPHWGIDVPFLVNPR